MEKGKESKKDRFKQQKKKALSATKKILLELLEGTGEFYEIGMRTYRPYAYPKDVRRDYHARSRYYKMKQVERLELIKVSKVGEKMFFELTEIGKSEGLKAKIIACEKELPNGQVCTVMFDIPESIRKVRDAFRQLLKDAGFYRVQRSVWETRMDVIYEMQRFVEMLGADDYIEVYRALPMRRR